MVDRGYAVSEVADRLGISTKSLYTWKAQFSKPANEAKGFCRKDFFGLNGGHHWTQLCCESGELFECGSSGLIQLALADHMRGFGPSSRCCRRVESLETRHWPRDPFNETMVLLSNIVKIFGMYDADDPAISIEFEDNVHLLKAS